MGRVIAIVNQKGGVGKTTTAINLSASLAMIGQTALLVDLDPQANATSGLGIEIDDERLTTYELLLDGADAGDALVRTGVAGLDLIPSTPRLTGAQIELVDVEKREWQLRFRLQSLVERYEFVLVDCPPSLGILTLNGLTAAQSVLIPIQCEYYALEGLSLLLQTLRMVQESLNPDLRIEGVLLTMYDGRLTLSQQVAQEAQKFFAQRVYRTIIPRNVRLSEAPSFGKPAVLYDPHCVGALSYMNLAKEVVGYGTESTWSRPTGLDTGARY